MPFSVAPDLHAPLLEWAQWYAAYGWRVFPCRGKLPLTLHGFHDASTDPALIDDWWRHWPDANIGSPTGGTWWALDVDPRAGGDDVLFALERQHGMLPHTLMSHTGGGGNHYLWQLPVGGIVNKAKIGAGLDVQGDGSYIILPPSIHPDTQRPYLWDIVDGPDDIAPVEAPDWLLQLVTALPGTAASPTAALLPNAPIPDGERDNTLAHHAISMAHAGIEDSAILAALAVMNLRCVPPLPDSDLARIAASAHRYQRPVLIPNQIATPLSTPVLGWSVNGMPPAAQPATTGPVWGSTPSPPPALHITDLADMFERQYPLPRWLVSNLIPEGLLFIIGSPKSSKTYLGYSLALSLAYEAQRGGQWLNHYPVNTSGPVVYVTLEDDEADSWYRIAELAPWLTSIERERFLFVHGYDFPSFDQGLVQVLEDQILKRYQPALVVLDPISYLYSSIKKSGDQFREVRDMLLPLRWLGRNYHCTIAGIDHRRKKSVDDIDIFETQYGSAAKGALADAMLVIVRDDKEITMHARLRKATDQTITLGFEFTATGQAVWTWKGSTDGLVGQGQYGDLRQQILNALSGSPIPMTIQDLLAGLNIPDSKQTRNAAYQILFRAQKSQEVQKTTRGQYVWAGGN